MTHDRESPHDRLVRFLRRSGAMAPDWAASFDAVPRGLFLPPLFWAYDAGAGDSLPVRADGPDPAEWERAAYRDVPLVTQWDDGRHTGTGSGAMATSSASMPSVVAAMLRDLDVRPGMTALEIGAGTGWVAGLLAHRLGGANVTTVEVDPAVAASARTALRRAGLHPRVVLGDGLLGRPEGAPYDRIIASVGVRAVPPAWLRQTRPGGLVLAPWGTDYSEQDALVRLRVDRDGTASGRFTGLVEFMKVRSQRLDLPPHAAYVPDFPGGAEVSATGLSPAALGGRFSDVRFVTGLAVERCAHTVRTLDDGTGAAWFYGLGDRSWAALVRRRGRSGSEVYQHGPRRLWDEVERALRGYAAWGRPEVTRFGLTVRPDGTTTAWLDDPGSPLTALLPP